MAGRMVLIMKGVLSFHCFSVCPKPSPPPCAMSNPVDLPYDESNIFAKILSGEVMGSSPLRLRTPHTEDLCAK